MAYSITLLDSAGQYATVHLSPDRNAIITAEATCTNHQLGPEWIEHASHSRSVERKEFLDTLLTDPFQDRAALIRQFLRSPLFNNQYEGSYGTLYTVAYQPARGDIEFFWPSQQIRISFDEFEERIISVNLLPSGEPTLTA
jgi:predicted choloylglycine hydrolase